jgi:predicted nucleic acid-binding protein
MRFALDSNIILYCEGLNDDERALTASRLIQAMDGLPVIVPCQALAEVLAVMIKKLKLPKAEILQKLKPWSQNYTSQATTTAVLESAFELVEHHQFQVWDAIILSASSFAGAEYFFSEDMQDRFTWRDMQIVNPFAENPHPIVPTLLKLN